MTISKLKFLAAGALAGALALGGLHAFARQFGSKGGEPDGGRGRITQPPKPDPLDPGVLPGMRNSAFGGRRGEPHYARHGDLFYVIFPLGDKFTIYDAVTNRASTIRLAGSKESPLKVSPILGEGHLSLQLEGSKIDHLYLFSIKDWAWYTHELKAPVDGIVGASASRSVAAYDQGRYVYAFSFEAKRWDVLELPEGVSPHPMVSGHVVEVEYDGHVDQFTAQAGEWKHTDFRALIDAAIKASRGDAEGEPGPPK